MLLLTSMIIYSNDWAVASPACSEIAVEDMTHGKPKQVCTLVGGSMPSGLPLVRHVPHTDKMAAIAACLRLKNKKQVRQFLGLASHYRKFVLSRHHKPD